MPDEPAGPDDRLPRAVILGCAGERLTAQERRFFAASDPLGFILFRRNCQTRDQLRALVEELRLCVGRADAPVLVDQEGGRVARLRPPDWRLYPAAAQIAALPEPLAAEAARLGARLIADDLAEAGITVDCAPVLDLPARDADPVIGDRAFGSEPARVAGLASAFCEGLLAGGVLPVIKHIPGHGRARVDSHQACPLVDADRTILSHSDFAPFRALSAMPWAMTAHIVFAAIDDTAPATFSRRVIDTIIRGEIGFEGVLVSDDIAMGALDGTLGERTCRALDAGIDLILHCNGVMAEMAEIVDAAAPTLADGPGADRARRSAAPPRAGGFRPRRRGAALCRADGGGMNSTAHAMAMLQQATTWVLPVIFAVTFHEAAHGFVAYRFGDDTAARAGRMTLNPLSHVDPFGTVLLPLLLFMTSGFLFGYAKPVPVNFGRLRHPRRDMVWVALAGPGMNVAAGDHLLAAVLRGRLDPAGRGAVGGGKSGPFDPAQRGAVRLQHAAVSAARRRPGCGRHPAEVFGASAGAG